MYMYIMLLRVYCVFMHACEWGVSEQLKEAERETERQRQRKEGDIALGSEWWLSPVCTLCECVGAHKC